MKHFSILLGALLGAFVAGSSAFYVTSAATHGQDYGFVVGVLLLCPMAMCLGAVLGIPVGLRVWRSGLHLRDRKSRRALTLKISGCVAVSFCLIVGLVQGAVSFCIPPSDRELMTNFQQHRSEFEQVVDMLENDHGLTRVADNRMNPIESQAAGVSSTRMSLYRQLLQSAHIPNGFLASDQGDEVDFFYWSTGSSLSSNLDKGYAYLSSPPTHVLGQLDKYQPDGPVPYTSYRHIEGNWYLFYEYIPS